MGDVVVPEAGGTFEIVLAIPADVVPGETLTALVECGFEDQPAVASLDVELTVAGGPTPEPTPTPAAPAVVTPAFTG